MKRHPWILGFTVMALFYPVQAQKMTVMDTDANVLMEVNDEGSSGSITLLAGAAPAAPAARLYNVGGTLYWNGYPLATTGGPEVWTDGGGSVILTTASDSVGVGTSAPSAKFTIMQSGNSWGDGLRLSHGGVDWDMKVAAGSLHFGRAGQGVFEFNNDGRAGLFLYAPAAAGSVVRFFENGTAAMEAGYDPASGGFYVGDATAAACALVIKRATGRAGIGTTNPQNILDVEGAIAVGAAYSGTNTAPANGMIVEGSVGIGTHAPLSGLDVKGSVAVGSGYAGMNAAPANGMIVEGSVGIGTSVPLSNLDIAGAAGYSQLRLRSTYTPTAYNDPNGNVGDIAWDDGYLYFKTSVGWKRAKWNNM
jgi:hypothetical protein